jgi:hypothetical protein
MPATYEINGPAVVWVSDPDDQEGTVALRLGVPESGCRVTYQRFHEKVITDVGGPSQPAAIQYFGMVGTVSFKLIAMDTVVLDMLRRLSDATAVGQVGSTGLLIDGTYGVHLWIDSRNGRPHHFHNALLWEGENEGLSSRRTEDDLQFFVWVPIDPEADTALNGTLWTYERPPGAGP